MRFNLKLVLLVVMPVVGLVAWWIGNDDLDLPMGARLAFLFIACCLVCSCLLSHSLAQHSGVERDESGGERSLP